MTAFDDAAAALFNDPNISDAAVYTSPTGEVIACRVIVMMPDAVLEPFDEAAVVAADRYVDVLAAEVTPQTDGTFTIDGADYQISQQPRVPDDDPSRLTYRSSVRAL